jgi:hypothetical protein
MKEKLLLSVIAISEGSVGCGRIFRRTAIGSNLTSKE